MQNEFTTELSIRILSKSSFKKTLRHAHIVFNSAGFI